MTWGKREQGTHKFIKQVKQSVGTLLRCASKPTTYTLRLCSVPGMTCNRTYHFLSNCMALNKENKTMLANYSFAQEILRKEFLRMFLGGLETWPSS